MSWDVDDELGSIDTGEEKLTKSRVIHVRVDPELFRYLRRAALAADKKPCDWIRRAITRAIAAEKAERKLK
jgi:predicted HicB family RNase H-like nuclease